MVGGRGEGGGRRYTHTKPHKRVGTAREVSVKVRNLRIGSMWVWYGHVPGFFLGCVVDRHGCEEGVVVAFLYHSVNNKPGTRLVFLSARPLRCSL